jgi:tRNA pseudouridine55 synthase
MLSGVLLVDKPQTWTSHDVCQFIKKKFSFNKVGHAGTLDPNATGLLVVLLNAATKTAGTFLNDDKEYEGIIKLGVRTSTGDSDGKIIEEKSCQDVSAEDVRALESVFRGALEQVPPMTSAVKKNGVRLYKLARQGKEIAREPRVVMVHEFRVEGIELPCVRFFVRASKGFYVRTLAEDIGERLGCGGTLISLRRLKSGNFSIEDAITVDALRCFVSVDELRPHVRVREKNSV